MNGFKTGLLLSYICIASLSAAIITPALPNIQTYFGLSKGAIEWVVSIFLLGYVIGQLVYAPIANRFGRLTALRTGLWVNLIGIGACLLSAHLQLFSLLLMGRLITALGAASGLTCTFMLINELLPQDRAKHTMSLAIVSFTLGIGLAVLIGGVITQYLAWQDCFIALLLHGIVMLLATYSFQEPLTESKPIHLSAIFQQYRVGFSHPTLIIFSLAIGFVSFFAYGYSASAPIYAKAVLHLTASEYGYWNSVNMIGMLLSGFIGVRLMKKYHEKRVLKIGFGGVSLGLIALALISFLKIDNSLLFFITTSYLYFTTGLIFPAASYSASTAITDKASASSVMSFTNMGSAMLGVILMGYLPFQSLSAFTLMLFLFFTALYFMVKIYR